MVFKKILVALLIVTCLQNVYCTKDILKKMSITFLKYLDVCKKELEVPEDMVESVMKYWREDQVLENRELGCLMLCMADKQDLLELEQYKVHKENSYDYAINHGADTDSARKIVDIVHDCEKKYDHDQDLCSKIMEMSKCFRQDMHQLKWAPSLEVIIGEIMMDI